jgi:hypothetical protein
MTFSQLIRLRFRIGIVEIEEQNMTFLLVLISCSCLAFQDDIHATIVKCGGSFVDEDDRLIGLPTLRQGSTNLEDLLRQKPISRVKIIGFKETQDVLYDAMDSRIGLVWFKNCSDEFINGFLKRSVSIENIIVEGTDGVGINDFAKVRGLTELEFSFCDDIVFNSAKTIGFSKLRKLAIEYCQVEESEQLVLDGFANVSELSLVGCSLSDTQIQGFRSLAKLEIVDLSQNEFSEKILEDLGDSITELRIGATKIQSLAPLRKLTHLRRLIMNELEIANDIGAIAQLQALQSIDLAEWPHPQVLGAIAALKKSMIRTIGLSKTRVSAEVLEKAGELLTLNEIDLRRNLITRQMLESLSHNSSICRIWISSEYVTEDVVVLAHKLFESVGVEYSAKEYERDYFLIKGN